MEAANRLYGITMQEKGVSTLISVNLADVEEGSGELPGQIQWRVPPSASEE